MQIRLPGTLQIGLSGGRGLAYDSVAYAARPGTFRVIDASAIVALLGVPVKAGQETVVPVAVDRLPPNANVERITATLTVVDGSAEKVTPVSVKENGGAPRTFSVSVDAAPGLRNVALRLQGGAPIWTHGGAVPAGAYQIPDFSAQANAYLDRAQINGAVVFQFVLTSEADGRVTLAVDADLQFSLLQSQSWKNPMDGTVRVDRNLQVDFNSVEVLDLDPIASAGSIKRTEIRLDVGGQLGADRLLGDVVEFDRHQHATISPDFSLAQPFSLAGTVVARPAQCSGVSAFLECDAPAEIYVELQPDADGAPRSGAPLAKSNVPLAPPQKGAVPSWTFAPFSAPAELTVDTPYWVVVKAVRGSARLGLRTDAAGATSPLRFGSALINRGGERWKSLASARESAGPAGTPVTALVGVVYVPGPDNQTAAVQLLLRDGAAEQRFDPSGQAATVVLGVPADSRRQATLVIRSHARGLLTVANVVQEYRVS